MKIVIMIGVTRVWFGMRESGGAALMWLSKRRIRGLHKRWTISPHIRNSYSATGGLHGGFGGFFFIKLFVDFHVGTNQLRWKLRAFDASDWGYFVELFFIVIFEMRVGDSEGSFGGFDPSDLAALGISGVRGSMEWWRRGGDGGLERCGACSVVFLWWEVSMVIRFDLWSRIGWTDWRLFVLLLLSFTDRSLLLYLWVNNWSTIIYYSNFNYSFK